ncbi:ABC-2 transporter permease [Anaerofustis sp. NSJ-163]|uniref:ABC-2 transporter permease n=1 Tax=Anaerofustis sp. NSJ-163 TaxID=2944391 RepID=UPI00209C2C83|nr:ABC-2 transporter permease [Anaerofustis sp. NSJ-163]MCO8193455.1 ABC-2 transporter permease [Anaerofustis sp. NSJ-163]
MKGLLLKDMYELIKQCKFILLFCVVYVFLSYTESGYFFLAFSIIFFSLLPTTIMALDERSKWESYAITMPYTRKEMVLSKYILSLGGVIFMSVLYEFVNIIIYFINSSYAMSIVDSFNIILPFCLMAIIISSVNLPINFKFGAEKGRLGTILICVVIGVIGGGLFSQSSGSVELINYFMNIPSFVYLVLIALLWIVSYFVSVKIYEKRAL